MDSHTFIQLTDTSLKMGLGALIAALVAWLVLWRTSQLHNNNSPRENRRLHILEEVSGQVGAVTHIFAKYSTLAIESIQFGERWPAARRLELDSVNTELVNEFRKLADSEAKLLMLGEKNLERALRLYGAKIALFRKQVYACRKDITPDQINLLTQSVAQVREQFYDILSRKYDRLLANA
jgi:hypothetical protein